MRFYEDVFVVKETLQNGNEIMHRKSVYSTPFKDGKNRGQEQRIADGIEILKKNNFYEIHHTQSKTTEMLFID